MLKAKAELKQFERLGAASLFPAHLEKQARDVGVAARRTALEGHLVRNTVKAIRQGYAKEEAASAIDVHLNHFDDVPIWSVNLAVARETFRILERALPTEPGHVGILSVAAKQ